jgi:hypothetical protein
LSQLAEDPQPPLHLTHFNSSSQQQQITPNPGLNTLPVRSQSLLH